MWKPIIPPQVSFFAWEASKECCLIIDNFGKRGKILGNACYFCKSVDETRNRLLLWCFVIHNLWIVLCKWVMAGSVEG